MLVAVLAVVLLTTLSGTWRQLAFSALNLVFVGGLLLSPVGTVSTLCFTVAGYGLARLAARDRPQGVFVGVVALTVAFVYLRRYDFLAWVLPGELLTDALATVGLSFLFFKIVHVVVDARSGTLGRLDFLTYLNYCLNFTTFMMGPIQRYQDYSTQWHEGAAKTRAADFEAQLHHLLRVLFGLVKAYVLAPYLQQRALPPDPQLLDYSILGLVTQTYAFWAYLYLNFSGYCDVAIGVGSLFGGAAAGELQPPLPGDRHLGLLAATAPLPHPVVDRLRLLSAVQVAVVFAGSPWAPAARRQPLSRHDHAGFGSVARDDAELPSLRPRPRALVRHFSHMGRAGDLVVGKEAAPRFAPPLARAARGDLPDVQRYGLRLHLLSGPARSATRSTAGNTLR